MALAIMPAFRAPARIAAPALDAGLPAAVAGIAIAAMPLLRPALPGNSALADLAIAAAILATLLWAGWTRVRLRLPYAVAMAALMAAGAGAALLGSDPGSGLLAVIQDFFLFAWCFALANLLRFTPALRTVLGVWAWSSMVWAALLIGAVLTGHQDIAGITARYGGRASLTFGDANLAGSYFVVGFMVMWAAGVPRRRVMRTIGLVLLAAAILLTGSNGGLLALGLAIIVTLSIRLVARAGVMAALALLIPTGLGVILLSGSVQFQRIQEWTHDQAPQVLQDSIGRSGESVAGRELLLSEEIGLLQQGGLIGNGPASTKSLLIASAVPYPKEAHQDYVASVVERGLLGGIGLLILISSLIVRSRMALGPKAADIARAVPQPAALVGALAGMALAANFYEVLHFRHVWALFAVIAALSLSTPSLTLPTRGRERGGPPTRGREREGWT
jgi:hypothetical protein